MIAAHAPKTSARIADMRRAIVLRNPNSTHAAQVGKYIADLQQQFDGNVRIVDTVQGGAIANTQLLTDMQADFGPDVLFCIAAGDGTVNTVVQFLANTALHTHQAVRHMPILPLWGGNANDLAYMLNGGIGVQMSFEKLLQTARIVPIQPLVITIKTTKRQKTVFAASYVTFGASANVARRLNDAAHRKVIARRSFVVRIIRELQIIGRVFRRAPYFAYDIDGKRERAYELVCVNGSRMAKVGRLPARLDRPHYYVDSLRHKRVGWVYRKALQLLRGGEAHRMRSAPSELMFYDALHMQYDGEPERLPRGARVVIAVHDTPFYACASKLS